MPYDPIFAAIHQMDELEENVRQIKCLPIQVMIQALLPRVNTSIPNGYAYPQLSGYLRADVSAAGEGEGEPEQQEAPLVLQFLDDAVKTFEDAYPDRIRTAKFVTGGEGVMDSLRDRCAPGTCFLLKRSRNVPLLGPQDFPIADLAAIIRYSEGVDSYIRVSR